MPHMGSLLTDQQNERSGSYQQGKQNTGDERNNPMPTIRALVRSSAFLRRSDTQPEEKFVHRTESAIIGAALWWPLHRISASCCPANCIAHRSSRETTGAPLATTALRGFLCFPARGRLREAGRPPTPACPGGTPAHQIRCARNI